jgi:hypothetical protein
MMKLHRVISQIFVVQREQDLEFLRDAGHKNSDEGCIRSIAASTARNQDAIGIRAGLKDLAEVPRLHNRFFSI